MRHLFSIALPVVLITALQLGACTRISPPPPGGVYRSQSAGGNFEQSVQVAGQAGEYIARFPLQEIERPSHDPNSIYIAAGDEGIVISHDDGASWEVVKTPLSFANDVLVLSNGIIVAAGVDGVGQGYVVRSADGGKSWDDVFTVPVPKEQKGITIVGGTEVKASIVMSIEVDPFHPDRVYGGSSLGTLFVGEQSAKVWHTLYTIRQIKPSPIPSREQIAVKKLIVSPHQADTLLIITQSGHLLRIANGTQQEIVVPEYISTPPPPLATPGSQTVLDAAFIPGFPDALVVGVQSGAVVTRDNGTSWLQLPVPAETNEEFNSVIVLVSPTNVNRIFVAINAVIYRSEDGGNTWNTFALGLPNFTITDVSINPLNAAKMLLVTQPLS